ncbi:S-layer homology domain-containing protein [Sporobacter termitidis DSM 10068]|uniref:S-layer homology domain-containing protein n=1 Tax=Sporobacter termitidis DSM 10068 TaxID=1123282 RepID=A0A1M5VTW1_9FIRM|nr:S-layer homology domain-containing protein [Sporobacter termitidis]SHH78628.1 S-layer homology domain-containing protein [Sporobacter termitidis DSM 10068]
MKKILTFVLCLALLVSTGVTALAADTSDSAVKERLTAITLKVKDTLGIDDSFTSFNGDLNETGAASLWALNWSNDKEQIYVSANENGTIVSYNDNVAGVSTPANGRIPKFPTLTIDDAKTIAGTFLGKVLDTKLSSVDLSGTSALDYSGSAVYYLNGSLKLHGVETPVSISVSVSAATRKVVSYYRGDDGRDYSGVTNPASAVDKAAAAETLKGKLNMQLVYALQGDGTRSAQLQYRPNPDGNYVVDAATGKLVDLSKLDYTSDSGSYSGSSKATADAAPAASATAISPVEQASIDKLEGVLPQSELEKIVRSYPELGLTDNFKLQTMGYYTYQDDKKVTHVTANMQFTYAPKDASVQYRIVTVDAKAGKLLSVNGNVIYYADGKAPASFNYTAAQTESTARSFAGRILPDELKETVLSGTTAQPDWNSARYYTFQRTHEGIAFPENYISVGVDANTGYVVSFSYTWYDDDVTFASSEGVISADTAAAKFSEGAGVALEYVSVPTSLQSSGLLLSYTKADTNVWGINALTGELLKATAVADTGLKYDDLTGNPYASIINKLASYGVGFAGGSFKPNAQLTQEDALSLIESTNGRKVVPLISAVDTDDIYNIAYSMGILTPAEKNPAKLISRVEFVKYLINALGYNEVANLQGIYSPGFKDDGTIPAGLAGYAAIAKGLGIIKGDQNGKFNPNDTATRTQAAIMLYNCMSRK